VSYVPVVVLVVLSVFGVSVLQAWVGEDGLKAASLERDVQREQERLTLLRARVAQLSAARRLRDEANKMGLVAPVDPVYLKAPVRAQQSGPLLRADAFAPRSP
jgi:cell division protein FtsL